MIGPPCRICALSPIERELEKNGVNTEIIFKYYIWSMGEYNGADIIYRYAIHIVCSLNIP